MGRSYTAICRKCAHRFTFMRTVTYTPRLLMNLLTAALLAALQLPARLHAAEPLKAPIRLSNDITNQIFARFWGCPKYPACRGTRQVG